MKKVLSITNKINNGEMISRGFNAGFRANGCYVFEKDIHDLRIEDIKTFKPSMIFGYDYGFLMSKDEELKKYIIENKEKYELVHYFADEPNSTLAYGERPELFEEYKKLGAHSFVWDKDFCEQLNEAVYLPLAVNAKAYSIESAEKQYEISFVGRPLTSKRQEVLAALIKAFGKKVNIFSNESHFLQSLDDMQDTMLLNDEEMETYKNSYRGFLASEKELAQVYQNSKINLNITLQGKTSLNYRAFEVPACLGFLINDNVEDLKENFEISREVESYTGVTDLIDKINFYLKNPEIALRIADNGYIKTVKKHNYTARANMLLSTVTIDNRASLRGL